MLLQINIEKLRSTQHSVCIHLLLIRLKPTLVLKILFFFLLEKIIGTPLPIIT